MKIGLLATVVVTVSDKQNNFDLLLSIITAAAAIIALALTVWEIRANRKLALFDKRFEVYSVFLAVISQAEAFSLEKLSEKGATLFWFYLFSQRDQQIANKYDKCQEAKKSWQKHSLSKEETEQYKKKDKKLETKYLECVDDLFNSCYAIYQKDVSVLRGAKLLFPEVVFCSISKLLEVYEETIMRMEIDDDIQDLIEKWKTLMGEIENKEIMKIMENKMDFCKQ